jgi:hypothetical protein
MADALRLLQAAIQAAEAGAEDLAIDFAQRAIQELGGEARPATLPWSTDSKDVERFEVFVRRAAAFLAAFAAGPRSEVPEDQARALAREFFAEQPRVVGPTFYRTRALEASVGAAGRVVRLTDKGQKYLKKFQQMVAKLDDTGAVY